MGDETSIHERVKIIAEGPQPGELIPAGEKIRVGRYLHLELSIADDALNRHHCTLLLRDNGIYVEDNLSNGGTYVGGQRIERRTLVPLGAEIRIGETVLRVVVR